MTSIAAKLRYGFGSMIAVCLLIVLSLATGLFALRSHLQEILFNTVPSRRASQEMILSVRGVALSTANYLASGSEKFITALEQDEADFEASYAKVQELAGRLLEGSEIGTRWRRFSSLAQTLVATRRNGPLPEDHRQTLQEFMDLEREIERILDRSVAFPLERNVENAEANLSSFMEAFYVSLAFVAALGVTVALVLAALIARSITKPIIMLKEGAEHVRRGDFSYRVEVRGRDEIAVLATAFNEMMEELAQNRAAALEADARSRRQDWVKTTLGDLSRLVQVEREVASLATRMFAHLCPSISAVQGALFSFVKREELLKQVGVYAVSADVPAHFRLGEGLVGQCAQDKQLLVVHDIPPERTINTGLTSTVPRTIVLVPLLSGNELMGVLELAFLRDLEDEVLAMLKQLGEILGIVLATIKANTETREHLIQSQALAHDLQTLNQELREKAELLDSKNIELERKNQVVEEARVALEEKAEQLSLTSRYKSQFLATMSHELRTPLNSLLILSRHLQENIEGNLTEKQIRYAQTINEAGRDLLNLITDILDLAKVESGTIALEKGKIELADVVGEMRRLFSHLAETKGLSFIIEESPEVEAIECDPKRFRQILKNLLSNAFKFTDSGSVRLQIELTDTEALFSVSDTGIGIPLDKQGLVFEAFQQVEADPNRRYAGTGLGLSISSELARRLGGHIHLESSPGKGSTFTLHLPRSVVRRSSSGEVVKATLRGEVKRELPPSSPSPISDDRDGIVEGDQVILIVEDDQSFAKVLLDVSHEEGFKALVTPRGEEAMHLAEMYKPAVITLDILLADVSGWTVLDRLKHAPGLRHIPVTLISSEDDKQHAYSRGAFSSLAKPVQRSEIISEIHRAISFVRRPEKRVLIVEDDAAVQGALKDLLESPFISTESARDGDEGIRRLRASRYDLLILDLRLPRTSGFELMDVLVEERIHPPLPVVIYTGVELSEEERLHLRRVAVNIILKDASSPARLLAEASLFLHLPHHQLTQTQQSIIAQFAESDGTLEGKRVLLVDDDVRNLFALAGLLEKNKMVVQTAESGEEALRLLEDQPVTDVVLLDMMMPGMDGYETARRLRENSFLRSIPIIAVTASVMKGDRERCLGAGASDYLPKPVEPDELIAMLRGWLYRDRA